MNVRFTPALAAATAALLLAAAPRPAAAQSFTAAAGNVTIKLTFPAGVTKAKGVLLFTARGLASGWAGSAPFADLAKKIEAPIAILSGGDDLNDNSYPGRCKSGEFNNVGMALDKMAMMANHPELAHVPLIGLGHSHGGDYWNWYNACHPERMAMVFVHASGGVNYSAASLKVPVFYTLGTGDLKERGSGMPRAGMFVNRAKGAPMSMVIGEGGHDSQFGAPEYAMVTALIEAIFKMRVPADADAAKGPVLLADIVEGDSTWVGDIYTKEISTFTAFKGNKAKTTFLPNEQLAMMWKGANGGPALPTSIVLPTDTCSWCGKPNDEPKATPGGPPITSTPSDAGGGSPPPDDAGAGDNQDAAAPSGSGGAGGSAPSTPPPAASGGSSGNTGGSTSTPPPKPAGSGGAAGATSVGAPEEAATPSACALAHGPSGGPGAFAFLATGLLAWFARRRHRG